MIREEDKKYELTENYKMLATAVVEQACKDYDDILRYNLATKQNPPHKSGAYKFLMDPDNFYLLFSTNLILLIEIFFSFDNTFMVYHCLLYMLFFFSFPANNVYVIYSFINKFSCYKLKLKQKVIKEDKY